MATTAPGRRWWMATVIVTVVMAMAWQKVSLLSTCTLLRYCRNVRPTWVKFDSKDTKESGGLFEVLSTKSKKRT